MYQFLRRRKNYFNYSEATVAIFDFDSSEKKQYFSRHQTTAISGKSDDFTGSSSEKKL